MCTDQLGLHPRPLCAPLSLAALQPAGMQTRTDWACDYDSDLTATFTLVASPERHHHPFCVQGADPYRLGLRLRVRHDGHLQGQQPVLAR